MLVLAAMVAAFAAPPATPTEARVRTRVTVRIVRGVALRDGRLDAVDHDRPVRGRAVLTEPGGSRREVQLYEFP